MAIKTFLHYLFSANKKPLYVDDAGHVQEGDEDYKKPNGQPAVLKKSPSGWKDVLIKYARNNTFFGLFRDMTVPAKFVKDGAKILNNIRWTMGVEAICFWGILKLDRTVTGYKYESWYVSEINFPKYRESETGVQVEALEGGVSKYFKANQNTVYEIPIDLDPEHVNVLNDGMEVDFSRTFIVAEQSAVDVDSYYLGMVESGKEGETNNMKFQDILPPKSSSVYPNDDWTGLSLTTRDAIITGTIKLQYNQSITAIIRAEVNDGLTSGGTVQTTIYSAAGTPGQIADIPVNLTVTIPATHRLHFKHTMFNPVASGLHYTILSGELRIQYIFRQDPTYIKGLYPFRLMEKLMEKATDGKFTIKSDWLLAKKDCVVTSGDAIRGIVTDDSDPANPIKGAVIKTSPMAFFKSFFARFSIGLGVKIIATGFDEKLEIEPLSFFFGSNTIIDLGQVSGAELSEAEDLMFNTIKAGYEKQDYTDANGRFEANQGQLWSTPITKTVKEVDLQSPYRADPYGIELLRINFDNKRTSDSESDNDTFLLNVETEAQIDTDADPDITYYNLNRPAYTSVTGIPHPDSAYNLEYTPKKGLLNNGPYLHSLFDLMDGGVFKMRSGDKNTDLSTTLAGVTVTEKDDIQIGALPAKLFRPNYITFTTQVPVTLLAILKSDPYGKVKFTWNSRSWYGYLWDGGIKPADNDTQVWKLISAPENDLSKFNGGTY